MSSFGVLARLSRLSSPVLSGEFWREARSVEAAREPDILTLAPLVSDFVVIIGV